MKAMRGMDKGGMKKINRAAQARAAMDDTAGVSDSGVPPVRSRLPMVAAAARGPNPMPMGVGMAKGGAVNQHKRMAMGEKVSGMKKGGRVC